MPTKSPLPRKPKGSEYTYRSTCVHSTLTSTPLVDTAIALCLLQIQLTLMFGIGSQTANAMLAPFGTKPTVLQHLLFLCIQLLLMQPPCGLLSQQALNLLLYPTLPFLTALPRLLLHSPCSLSHFPFVFRLLLQTLLVFFVLTLQVFQTNTGPRGTARRRSARGFSHTGSCATLHFVSV